MEREIRVLLLADAEATATREALSGPRLAVSHVEPGDPDAVAAERARDAGLDALVVDAGLASVLEAVTAADPAAPVLAVTDPGDPGTARAALDAGADAWAPRPTATAATPLLRERLASLVEAERTRRRLTERVERFVDALPGIVYRCRNEPDWPMEVVRGDCEALTGYPASALEDGRVRWGADLIHPEDADDVWETVQSAVAEGREFEVRYRIETAGGETRWMWERGRGVSDATGDVKALEGFITDVTEQADTEERLRRETERLERFASIVSHDLRNPLAVARGRLDLAREECESTHHQSIEDSLARMESLVENLLTLARQGASVGDVSPVRVDRLAAGCWEQVETGGASIVCRDPVEVAADETRLRQVLENLFRNSVEHGGPEVTVTVGRCDGGFYVADDGPGVPPEDRERVFEPSCSTGESGTGLGLAIVAEIAAAHGWSVTLTESEHGGARFEFDTGGDAGS